MHSTINSYANTYAPPKFSMTMAPHIFHGRFSPAIAAKASTQWSQTLKQMLLSKASKVPSGRLSKCNNFLEKMGIGSGQSVTTDDLAGMIDGRPNH